MSVTKALARLTIFAGLMALPNAISTAVYAQQAVTVGATDIGGTVVGASGPEAGVWVIAETTELPTKFARIIVTDDQGRYLIPDLPTANYSIWVRGYGLVDSAKLTAKPGQLLNHTAVPAPNEAAAAHFSASMPRASMGGSTIRMAAGKAADCGARTATARPGSRKAARAQCLAPCTSSFGPIRWRTEVRRDNLNAPRRETAV